MSTSQPTPGVPVDFDEYLAGEHATPTTRQPCDGCGRSDQRCWTINGTDVQCEACLRGWHNTDKTEQRMLHALIGGTVKAALDQEISPTVIRAAVDQAIDEHVDTEVAALRANLTGQLPADTLEARLADAEQAWRS